MSTDAMLNQSEPNVILTAHATKVNRPEPNWTEPQTCLACRNHAYSCKQKRADSNHIK